MSDAESFDRETPLSMAIRAGDVVRIGFLIRHGADVNRELPDGENYLVMAMRAGEDSVPIARELLDAGADFGPRGAELWTALHWAAILDAWEIAALLIERGAEVDALDLDDVTPLQQAAFSGSAKVVRVLLRAGADRSIRSFWLGTAEETALERGNFEVLREIRDFSE